MRTPRLLLILAACGGSPAGTTDAGADSTGGDGTGGAAPTSSGDGTGGGSSPTSTSSASDPGDGTDASGTPDDTDAPADSGEHDSSGSSSGGVEPEPYPEPGAFPPNHGPGGPTGQFTPEQVGKECAALDGGMPGDLGDGEAHDTFDHHNLVVMFDGYLVMPWAPEYGLNAGVTLYDFADPCAPVAVASALSNEMRESHSLGFANYDDGWYMVADQMSSPFAGGIEFWDVTDPAGLKPVSRLEVPGFFYPDAYQRVTLSVFWQVPYVYVAGADNGIYVVDASDPMQPKLVQQYEFDPVLRVGQVQAVGNLLMASAAEGTRTALLDISNPGFIQPIAGGEFAIAREAYFSNIGGGYAYYAPKTGGGGLEIYDIRDPGAPALVGDYSSGGNGGYVFIKDELAFVGESDFANIYDISEPSSPKEVMKLLLKGDLDTITPIGNVAVLSVDDKADKDRGSIVVPYTAAADTTPPGVTWAWPADGATGLAVTSRFGLTFNEMIDVKSAWAGSVRLYEAGTDPASTRVDGHVSVQEHIVTFAPKAPLKPGTQYTLELPAGGVRDYSGNPLVAAFTASFTTAG
ncbi:MAG: Ig-like domain-containing protein [Myxococcales bacterium]|nr:Ig-like domain-containing protein [Myxococcales bacterium]